MVGIVIYAILKSKMMSFLFFNVKSFQNSIVGIRGSWQEGRRKVSVWR